MIGSKTYSPKQSELKHDWFIIDANGKTLGRLAAAIAPRLMGKHRPTFSPHVDGGDNIVVINVDKIVVTGSKLTDKQYHRHSGYPGGITSTNLETLMSRKPTAALEHAVAGMLPKNKLRDVRMARLKLFVGSEHAHTAQTPKPLEI